MSNYEKLLNYANKLKIEYRVIFVLKLMKKINREIEEAILQEKNLMLSQTVNHRILGYTDIYSNVLGKINPTEEKTEIDLSGFNMLVKNIPLEEKLILVYNIMQTVVTAFVLNFCGDFKLEPDSFKIVVDKEVLQTAKESLKEFSNSIKSARVLEYKGEAAIDLENSGAFILR